MHCKSSHNFFPEEKRHFRVSGMPKKAKTSKLLKVLNARERAKSRRVMESEEEAKRTAVVEDTDKPTLLSESEIKSEKPHGNQYDTALDATDEDKNTKKQNKNEFDRLRQRTLRANESEVQRERRRERDRKRRAIARKNEPESKRQVRLLKDRQRQIEARKNETESQRQTRLEKDRTRKAAKRVNKFPSRKRKTDGKLKGRHSNGKKMSVCPAVTHSKSRTLEYSGTSVQRFSVPDEFVDWNVPYAEYKPVDYTAEKILRMPPYADPDIRKNAVDPPLKFNELDTAYNVDRTSYTGKYEVVDGVPRNPVGRTGMVGRGLLGRWGPNHAADPIVSRWKHNAEGKKVMEGGKPVLEFVAIKRRDNGQWALPGGMVDPGDDVSNTLKKEFGEEAMNSMELSQEERKKLHDSLSELFKHGHEIFKGYVDDPRNTDNAWMESKAVNFHDEDGQMFDKFQLQAGDDAGDVRWMEIGKAQEMYANHGDMLGKVARLRDAHL